jgi:hypothetical protein
VLGDNIFMATACQACSRAPHSAARARPCSAMPSTRPSSMA